MKLLATLALSALSFSALANWTVDSQQSSLSFVTVKNELIAETHQFKQLSGSLSDSGELTLQIPVSSLETNIPLRNERILQYLLMANEFATIQAKAKVDMNSVAALKAGQSLVMAQAIDLTLLNQSQTLTTSVRLTMLADGKMVATTTAPVVLDLTKFKLDGGVEKLRELAGLKVISPLVPVGFSVTFSK